MFCALSIDTMVMISSEHLRSTLAMSVFDMGGSSGNSAILRPRRVSSPSSSSAPRLYSVSSAVMSVAGGGGSMKSKPIRSLMPSDLSMSTTLPRLVRWISGTGLLSSSCWYDHAVYRRKAFPGAVRPARPARCIAAALDTGVTTRLAMPLRGLKAFCLTNPGSMTYLMPSMVSDVSAMLVASTILRAFSGVGSKIFACNSLGRLA
mmetsp:Transcript_10773/g.44578  ORF Transcript_10773/g.44578 Transcript_10773/m.44578 type:complete len:205 (-) Transcript_10773:1826-2440(-)